MFYSLLKIITCSIFDDSDRTRSYFLIIMKNELETANDIKNQN